MLRIVVLGCGTGVPHERRGSPAAAIQVDDRWILVDSGSGTLQRMARKQIDYRTLEAIAYTHSHPDHTADLVPLLFAMNHTPGYTREKELMLIGPRGFSDFVAGVLRPFPSAVPRSYQMNVREVWGDELDRGDVVIRSASVDHGDCPTVAYRFDLPGASVVFSGDCSPCEAIVGIARDADALVIEASFPTADCRVGHHMTAVEAGDVGRKANVNTLVINHMYPVCNDDDMYEAVTSVFDGRVIIAQDLLELNVG